MRSSTSATDSHAAAVARRPPWPGLALALVGSIAFSGKAIIVKLAYRYGVDAVTLIMYRMLFALPLFALGQLVIFAIGVPWLAVAAHLGAAAAIDAGFTPFIVGGLVKAAIAGVAARATGSG